MSEFDDILGDDCEQDWVNPDAKKWHKDLARWKAEADVKRQIMEEMNEEIEERIEGEYKKNIKLRFDEYNCSDGEYYNPDKI